MRQWIFLLNRQANRPAEHNRIRRNISANVAWFYYVDFIQITWMVNYCHLIAIVSIIRMIKE
jgi:hypothetical protein